MDFRGPWDYLGPLEHLFGGLWGYFTQFGVPFTPPRTCAWSRPLVHMAPPPFPRLRPHPVPATPPGPLLVIPRPIWVINDPQVKGAH